jgi:hypothetical protein
MSPETFPRRKRLTNLELLLEEMDKEIMVSSLLPPLYTLSMLDKDGHNSLHAEGQRGEKVYLLAIDAGASVTIARLDIAAGLPERDPPMKCALQAAS